MKEATRNVFHIARFSIHDGPGIRTTVFLKGCPLDCWWCHNPESLSPQKEALYRPARCIRCGACQEACPTGAVSGQGVCQLCGTCEEACPVEARQIVGREMTPTDVLTEVLKDRPFFDESGGGVTFSGGEPLLTPDFLERVLEGCRTEGVHTAVDTCGYASEASFRRIRPKVDLFLYDIKLLDDERHRAYTGVSNEIIRRNLEDLVAAGACVAVRLPLVPGINDDEENIRQTGEYLVRLGLGEIHVLPYHSSAEDKYARLRRPYRLEGMASPSPDGISRIVRQFESFGLRVQVGG